MANNPLRHIPSVHELLESPPLRRVVDKVSHHVVVSEVRSFLDHLRGEIQQKAADVRIPAAGELADRIPRNGSWPTSVPDFDPSSMRRASFSTPA